MPYNHCQEIVTGWKAISIFSQVSGSLWHPGNPMICSSCRQPGPSGLDTPCQPGVFTASTYSQWHSELSDVADVTTFWMREVLGWIWQKNSKECKKNIRNWNGWMVEWLWKPVSLPCQSFGSNRFPNAQQILRASKVAALTSTWRCRRQELFWPPRVCTSDGTFKLEKYNTSQ